MHSIRSLQIQRPMFDNVLYQSATALLAKDIQSGKLPGSILFSGPAAAGKLTCALETARVLSCREKGEWSCRCASCQQHKALVSTDLLLAGSGDKTLEIRAAKETLLVQNANNTKHLEAARYLYLRAVRKLTARFSPVLWEGDDKLSKFSPLLQAINDDLENLNPGRRLPDGDALQKILDDVEKQCGKLEDGYLYDALPVSQIRNFSAWAHLTSSTGKKVLIIENADSMADSARNALLKILEEPPEGTVFILTTSRRGAMLPTILSRVRTYTFFPRTTEQQQDVIRRVFHHIPAQEGKESATISDFLQSYLPISPGTVRGLARQYFATIAQGHVPDIPAIMTACGNFSPRILFSLFLQGIIEVQRGLCQTAAGTELSIAIMDELRKASNNVGVFNQNPAAALELLTRNIMQINHLHNGILRKLGENHE